MALPAEGYTAPRASELLLFLRDQIEANLLSIGEPSDVDWERDTFYAAITAATSVTAGRVSEATQAIYDSFNRNNAEGVQLDNLGEIIGVIRNQPTKSQAVVTFGGTPATVIPIGTQVRGGGDNDDAVWETTEEYIIGGGGTVDGDVFALEAGPTVAGAGTINEIVTPVLGLNTVTNTANALVGQSLETDAEYRIRQVASLQVSGLGNLPSLRADLLNLDYLEAVLVFDNPTENYVNMNGIVMNPHSGGVVVYPGALSTEQEEEIAAIIYRHLPAGIYSSGDDVVKTVQTLGVSAKTIRFNYAVDFPITVDIVVVLEVGYELIDVEQAVIDGVTEYFDQLPVGRPARLLEIYSVLDDIEGIVGATIELNGVSADYIPLATQKLVVDGVVSVSV